MTSFHSQQLPLEIIKEQDITQHALLEGIFGSRDRVPLLTDIFPESLVEAIVCGYHVISGWVSGILQNDGRILPGNSSHREVTTFSPFCKLIRSTIEGRRRCIASDCEGAQYALEKIEVGNLHYIKPLGERTTKLTRYLCHCGLLETISSVQIYLGRLGKLHYYPISLFWGGQKRLIDQGIQYASQMEAYAQDLGIADVNSLINAWNDLPIISIQEMQEGCKQLISTAKDLGKQATRSYKEHLHGKVSKYIAEFTAATGQVLMHAHKRGKLSGFLPFLESVLGIQLTHFNQLFGCFQSAIYLGEFKDRQGSIHAVLDCVAYASGDKNLPAIRNSLSCDGTSTILFRCFNEMQDIGISISIAEAASDPILKKFTSINKASPDSLLYCAPIRYGDGIRGLWLAEFPVGSMSLIGHDYIEAELGRSCLILGGRLFTDLEIYDMACELEKELIKYQSLAETLQNEKINRIRLVRTLAHEIASPGHVLNLLLAEILDSQGGHIDSGTGDAVSRALEELRLSMNNFIHLASTLDNEEETTQTLRLPPQTTSLLDILNEADKSLQPFLRRTQIQCQQHLNLSKGMNIPNVNGASTELRNVIFNILHNAVKYTLGSHDIEIHIDLSRTEVHVRIINYGIGIEDYEKELIFQINYRSKRASYTRVPGTGIGLWIAKQIMNSVRGGIILENSKPTGEKIKEQEVYKTTFRIDFQRAN